jgi:hypothetical protein
MSDTAHEQYQSWQRGFVDGVRFAPMNSERFTHRDGLREAYELGYSEGRNALNAAALAAQKRYGYTPTILRLQDTPPPNRGREGG